LNHVESKFVLPNRPALVLGKHSFIKLFEMKRFVDQLFTFYEVETVYHMLVAGFVGSSTQCCNKYLFPVFKYKYKYYRLSKYFKYYLNTKYWHCI